MSETALPATDPGDIRPVVPLARSGNAGLYAFGAVLVIGGVSLFSALSANRAELQAPATSTTIDQAGARIAAPPPLALPPGYLLERRLPGQARDGAVPESATPLAAAQNRALPPVIVRRVDAAEPAPFAPMPPAPSVPQDTRPSVVFDTSFAPAAGGAAPVRTGNAAGTALSGSGMDRVTADRLANPSRTVPRGTVIQAVLETALDSSRPGAARGLVQRDVYAFDGSRVLIPRGSRLYGEYASDLSGGQRRAAIQWTRLLRPDGVTIELDSPASDPLGRAGVTGKIDSKFFQRFGGAILQSVLDIGVGIATREASDGVIVALPGSTKNLRVAEPQQIQPTLKVRQGTSVSVFVARDLDFSSVDP